MHSVVATLAALHLNAFDYGLDLLGLSVELAEGVRECHVCLGHVLQRILAVLVLIEHQREGEFALSSLHILRTELGVKKVQDHSEVLLCLFIVITVDGGVGIVFDHERVAEVLLGDELAPDLHDLLVEVASVDGDALLFEYFAHIEIAAAEVNAFRAIELALQIDCMRELIQGLLGGVGLCRGAILM